MKSKESKHLITNQLQSLRVKYTQLYRFTKSKKFSILNVASKRKVEQALVNTFNQLKSLFSMARPMTMALGMSAVTLFSCSSDDGDDETGANESKGPVDIADIIFEEKSLNAPFTLDENLDYNWVPVLALGDLDNDGDLDALMGAGNGKFYYMKNNGTSHTFYYPTTVGNPMKGVDIGSGSAPAFADLDNDDDLDLLIGKSGGDFDYYKNTGSKSAPTFTKQSTHPFSSFDVGSYSVPFFEDIDGDGDQDMIAGASNGVIYPYYNTGTKTAPTFVYKTALAAKSCSGGDDKVGGSTSIDVGSYSKPTLADIDNDGDLDLIVGSSSGSLSVYENSQKDTLDLTVVCDDDNPMPLATSLAENGNADYSSAQFADIDGDGDLDMITAVYDYYYSGPPNYNSSYNTVIKYWKNK